MRKHIWMAIFLGIGIGLVISSGINMMIAPKVILEPERIKSEAKKLGMIDPVEYFDKTEKKDAQLDTTSKEKITIEIPKGITSEDVAELLKEKKLITSEKTFLNKIHEKGLTYKIKWGKYKFSADVSMPEIIDMITQNSN
ncbi:hypothetical protein QBE52_09345 [Clostridiaceae bacterium 35-E11]